jgi:O-antigen/teichoic acid export membrane protein
VGTELIMPMNRAALPTYSRLGEDRAAIGRAYLSVLGLVALLVAPLIVGLAALAPLVVAVLLGPQWRDLGPLISLLAFHGLTNIFLRTAHAPVLACGRPMVYVKIFLFQVCLMLPLMFWMTREYGVRGAVIAAIVTALGLLPFNATVVARTLEVKGRELLAKVWRPLLAAALMYVVIVLAQPPDAADSLTAPHALSLLAVFVPLGALIYAAAVLVIWGLCGRPAGAELTLLELAGRHWQRFLRRARGDPS